MAYDLLDDIYVHAEVGQPGDAGTNFLVPFSGDFNDFTTPMPPTLIYPNPGSSVANKPGGDTSTQSFLLGVSVSYANNTYSEASKRIVQQAFGLEDYSVWTRFKNSSGWHPWMRNDNYGTSSLSELASALGVNSELNRFVEYIKISPDTSSDYNLPSGYNEGIGIAVKRNEAGIILQIALLKGNSGSGVYYRYSWALSPVWSAWTSI